MYPLHSWISRKCKGNWISRRLNSLSLHGAEHSGKVWILLQGLIQSPLTSMGVFPSTLQGFGSHCGLQIPKQLLLYHWKDFSQVIRAMQWTSDLPDSNPRSVTSLLCNQSCAIASLRVITVDNNTLLPYRSVMSLNTRKELGGPPVNSNTHSTCIFLLLLAGSGVILVTSEASLQLTAKIWFTQVQKYNLPNQPSVMGFYSNGL